TSGPEGAQNLNQNHLKNQDQVLLKTSFRALQNKSIRTRTMTLSSVLLILLQICSLQLMATAKPTCLLQGNLLQSAHHLLRDLGGPFPLHCLPYNVNISFPDSLLLGANHSQCRRALRVVFESLQRTGVIFEDHELPVGEGGVTWDENKLDDFQNLQYRLLEEGSCVSTCLSVCLPGGASTRWGVDQVSQPQPGEPTEQETENKKS
ncbi:hypothetical protein L3Q82_013766, partial [Scortum barcoo]